MGASFLNRTSMALWFFGVGKRTGWPTNNSSRSDHGIICGVHLKSFKNLISQSSASCYVYLSFEGLTNVLNMCCSRAKRYVFLQFAGSIRIMSRFLPLPLTKALRTASAKATERICFQSGTSRAHIIDSRLQTSMHLPLSASLMTSILGIPLRSSGALALTSLLVLSNRSSMDFLFLVTQNFAKSLFPSRDLRLAMLHWWFGPQIFQAREHYCCYLWPRLHFQTFAWQLSCAFP